MFRDILLFSISAVAGFLAREIFFGEPHGNKPKFVFTYKNENGRINIGDFKNMQLRKNQSVVVTAKPVGAEGEAADIQTGSAVWKSSDEAVVTVTVNPDNELEATVSSKTAQGVAVISLEADGDPSDLGDLQIIGTADVRVLGENAVGFDLTFGEPAGSAA